MRTPGHALVNVALLLPALGEPALWPILTGAVLPDLPIVVLYLLERARGLPEARIWAERYQARAWLAVIHGAHSIPLALLLCALGAALSSAGLLALGASLLLHDLLDLPVHGRDAHRHLLPLSQWRWESPFSYWEPARHAREVTLVEAALATSAGVWLLSRGPGGPAAAMIVLVVLGYARLALRALAPARA